MRVYMSMFSNMCDVLEIIGNFPLEVKIFLSKCCAPSCKYSSLMTHSRQVEQGNKVSCGERG